MSKVNYIDGIVPSVARRIARFTFGDELFKFEVNQEKRQWDVYLKQQTDEEDIAMQEARISVVKEHFVGYNFIIVNMG